MTKFLSINDAMKKGSGKVSIRGWCYRERGSKKLKFIVLRDSTNIIQCVIEKSKVSDKTWECCESMHIETSMIIDGTIKKDDRAPSGYEVNVIDIKVIGSSTDYPIQKDQSIEHLANNRHLWLRSRKMTSILKIRSTVIGATDEYFRTNGFFQFHSPIFQAVQCEGGSDLFTVDYFGKKDVFLTQTWQLYAEAAIFGLENIYTISPTFRAEKSKTSRHLTEFWMAEMEMAWANFDQIIDHGEKLLKFIVKKVLDNHKEELKILERDVSKLEPVIKKPFIRMTYDEAIKILDTKCNLKVPWGKDLRTIEEEKLTKLYDVPIICTHYPKKVKAFYMTEDPNNPKVVQGCDFLAPEGYGEVIGGSHREHKIENIKERLITDGEDPKEYEFYLDTRRYGSVPHGGFGMGVERVVRWVCGLENIKDAIPFPRTMLRYKP
jgi:asparaginyl-tRNA synthetase